MTSLSSLGISPAVISKLSDSDFYLDSDVSNLLPSELSSASQLSLEESAKVIKFASSKPTFESLCLKNLIQSDDEPKHIFTFCQSIDDILGGGIPLKAITELCGVPGIGKTQMCLQSCMSVQLPEEFGGVDGEAVFIDTEGSFSIARLKEMADVTEIHLRRLSGSAEGDFKAPTAEDLLKKVYYFRCRNRFELVAVVRHLSSFMDDHPRVRLVVIDSVAFHFRHDFSDVRLRTGVLCALSQNLIQLASKHGLAVLVTNQMTTKVDSRSGSSEVIASLGETWAHCPTVRLLLHWTKHSRTATILKAPHVPNASASFKITRGGLRDSIEDSMNGSAKRKFTHDP